MQQKTLSLHFINLNIIFCCLRFHLLGIATVYGIGFALGSGFLLQPFKLSGIHLFGYTISAKTTLERFVVDENHHLQWLPTAAPEKVTASACVCVNSPKSLALFCWLLHFISSASHGYFMQRNCCLVGQGANEWR